MAGFVLHAIWKAVQDLQQADKNINDRVGKIEVLVAGAYVTRDEFRHVIDAMFAKLDKIDIKLDTKADK